MEKPEVKRFLFERCEPGGPTITRELYKAYLKWCEVTPPVLGPNPSWFALTFADAPRLPMGINMFSMACAELGVPLRVSENVRMWMIQIKAAP